MKPPRGVMRSPSPVPHPRTQGADDRKGRAVTDDVLPDGRPEEFLSPREAAERYELAPQTLVSRLRLGAVPGYKVRGPRGREWRVSTRALETHGYLPRQPRPVDQVPDVAALEASVRELRRTVAFERRRADELDGLLGQASLEIGRLRAEVANLRRPRQDGAGDDAEPVVIDLTVVPDPRAR